MDIILLHSDMVAESRDLLASLGVAIPEGDDVTVTVETDTVRIVSKHALAVGVCPAFPGYPAALVGEGEAQRLLTFPDSWAAVLEWATNPPAEVAASSEMSVTAFFERFTDVELVAARELAKTDAVVDLFWVRLLGASIVDLAYPPVVSGVRYLVGKLPGFDAARADAVLGATA